MTFQPRTADQRHLVRQTNAVDALRHRTMPPTDYCVRLQFSHPERIVWTPTPLPHDPHPFLSLVDHHAQPLNMLSDDTVRYFQAGTALPRQKSELQKLRNHLRVWEHYIGGWLEHCQTIPALQNRTEGDVLRWTFRFPPSQIEINSLSTLSLGKVFKRIRHDLTLAVLCPMMSDELRRNFVGRRPSGTDSWANYVLEKKIALMDELRERHDGLRIKMFRRSVLKVLDETILPTDCGRMITQFLLPEDPQ